MLTHNIQGFWFNSPAPKKVKYLTANTRSQLNAHSQLKKWVRYYKARASLFFYIPNFKTSFSFHAPYSLPHSTQQESLIPSSHGLAQPELRKIQHSINVEQRLVLNNGHYDPLPPHRKDKKWLKDMPSEDSKWSIFGENRYLHPYLFIFCPQNSSHSIQSSMIQKQV